MSLSFTPAQTSLRRQLPIEHDLATVASVVPLSEEYESVELMTGLEKPLSLAAIHDSETASSSMTSPHSTQPCELCGQSSEESIRDSATKSPVVAGAGIISSLAEEFPSRPPLSLAHSAHSHTLREKDAAARASKESWIAGIKPYSSSADAQKKAAQCLNEKTSTFPSESAFSLASAASATSPMAPAFSSGSALPLARTSFSVGDRGAASRWAAEIDEATTNSTFMASERFSPESILRDLASPALRSFAAPARLPIKRGTPAVASDALTGTFRARSEQTTEIGPMRSKRARSNAFDETELPANMRMAVPATPSAPGVSGALGVSGAPT